MSLVTAPKDRRLLTACLCGREAGWDGWCARCHGLYGDGAWAEVAGSEAVMAQAGPERLTVQTRIATGEPVSWVGHYGRQFRGAVLGYNVDTRVYHVRLENRAVFKVPPLVLESSNPSARRAAYISRPGMKRPHWTFRHLIDCDGCGLYWGRKVTRTCERCGSGAVRESALPLPKGGARLLVYSDGTPPVYVA